MQYSIPRILFGVFRICVTSFNRGVSTPSKSSPLKLRGFLKYSVNAWLLAAGKVRPSLKKLFNSFLYSSGSSTRISASSFSALISPDSLPKQSISTISRLSNRETPPIAKASALAVEMDTGISSTRSAPHRRAISARACLEMRAGVPRCT